MDIRTNITTINKWNNRSGYKIEGIVIHSMWGFYDGTIQWFKNPNAKVSAHYVIKSDGEITMCVEEQEAAWHSGNVTVQKDKAPELIRKRWGINPNFITIGIELEDKRQKERIYPDLQYKACVELVADICKRYNIDANRGNIMMHKETDPVNKTDPVGQWDHEKFVNDVKKLFEEGGVGQPEKFYPFKTRVRVKKGIDVLYNREGADRVYPLAGDRQLKGGTAFDVLGFVKGERVEAVGVTSQFWWKKSDGTYVWSGGTTLIPTLDNFPDELIKRDKLQKTNMEEKKQLLQDLKVRAEELQKFFDEELPEREKEAEQVDKEIEKLEAELAEEAVEEPSVAEPVEVAAEEAPEEAPVVEEEPVEEKKEADLSAEDVDFLRKIKDKLGW